MSYYTQALDPDATFTVTLGVDTLLSEYVHLNFSSHELTPAQSNPDYDGLQVDCEDLETKYDVLLGDYYDLKSEQDALTDAFDTTRNLNYIFIVTTVVFIATTAYLTTRKPKVEPESRTT